MQLKILNALNVWNDVLSWGKYVLRLFVMKDIGMLTKPVFQILIVAVILVFKYRVSVIKYNIRMACVFYIYYKKLYSIIK